MAPKIADDRDRDQEFEPLPFYPFDARPKTFPLSEDEAATAIYLSHGNLRRASALLKVPIGKLSRLVRKTPRLQREVRLGEAVARRL